MQALCVESCCSAICHPLRPGHQPSTPHCLRPLALCGPLWFYLLFVPGIPFAFVYVSAGAVSVCVCVCVCVHTCCCPLGPLVPSAALCPLPTSCLCRLPSMQPLPSAIHPSLSQTTCPVWSGMVLPSFCPRHPFCFCICFCGKGRGCVCVRVCLHMCCCPLVPSVAICCAVPSACLV